jgi:peptidoglycan/LPS O-acetylase OafA/YrhL
VKYRSEIDGLRAIAVIPVLLFHAGFPYLTGGFVGVDVFFVISGFLITSILIKEIDNKNFSILKFYERRARRILPALFFVLFCSALIIPFINNSPNVLTNFGESILSVVLFVSNIYFWLNTGYFGETSELSPLLHTWSLAVEEQYYLFFPLLAAWIYPKAKGELKFGTTLIFIIILSLVAAEWGVRNDPIGNFYLITSRAWELLFGSMAALIINKSWIESLNSKLKSALSMLGLLLITVSYFTFSPNTAHPSLITVVPVMGTVLVLLFCHKSSLSGRILTFQPMVFVGLISYSLYLWHQPILAFAKMHTSIHLATHVQLVLLVVIFMISYLSWRFIENPFRNKHKFTPSRIAIMSCCSIIFMFILGGIYKENINFQKAIYPEDMQRYEILLSAHNSNEVRKPMNQGCNIWSKEFTPLFMQKFNECSEMHGKALFILGGSHGTDLYNAIALNSQYPFIVSISRGNCRAHNPIGLSDNLKKCQYRKFEEFSRTNKDKIALVLYTQIPNRLFNKHIKHASKNDLSLEHVDQVVEYFSRLKENHQLNIIMVGMWPSLLRSSINLNYRKDLLPQIKENYSENTIVLTRFVDSVFKAKLGKKGIPYISKMDSFGLSLPEDLFIENALTYKDNNHLSNKGEEVFGKRFVSYFNSKYEHLVKL